MIAEELIYQQGEREIVQQQDSLSGIWTRVGILLSVAAISTSVLGGQALRSGPLSCWGIGALLVFAGIGLIALAILWPRTWTFKHDTNKMLEDFAGSRSEEEMASMFRALAESAAIDANNNQRQIDRMLLLFQVAAALLVVDVGLWMGELGLG